MRKILVLDDQPDSLTTLQAILEYRGYSEVKATSNPAETIRICEEGYAADLLVCDVILRASMTGAEAGLEIHRLRPDLPILFTSGTALEGLDEADFGALSQLLSARVGFLQKPFTAGELISASDRLLGGKTVSPDFVRAMKRAAVHRLDIRRQRPHTFRAGS